MEAYFLPFDKGPLFCVHHPARDAGPVARSVVFVHAFAEEMNKSRHVVAQTARRLADAGIGVLTVDLFGCGDSAGALEDATWQDWHENVLLALEHLRARGQQRLFLWGMRLGAVLAAEVAQQRPDLVSRCIFWQPTVNGAAFLTQFLRLRMANAMLTGAKDQETTKALRARLHAGESLEVAGYALTPALATAIEQRGLEAARPACPTHWFEIVAEENAPPVQATARVVSAWRGLGSEVALDLVAGEPFWGASNATELVQCESIVEATARSAESWS